MQIVIPVTIVMITELQPITFRSVRWISDEPARDTSNSSSILMNNLARYILDAVNMKANYKNKPNINLILNLNKKATCSRKQNSVKSSTKKQICLSQQ